jgi:hypothetical protein
MTHDSYSSDNLKHLTYDSTKHRNDILGYNYLLKRESLDNYNDKFFTIQDTPSYAVDPDMMVNTTHKSILDNPNAYPNLYDDNIIAGRNNNHEPNRYRTWEPLTSSAVPSISGEYNKFTPHTPQSVGANVRNTYWVADLNGQLMDRKISLSAKEQPYANFYRRQGLISLISQNMIPTNDSYTKRIIPDKS